jgi:hypothetical protein
VQREKRKAKASVLGRVDNEDLKLVCLYIRVHTLDSRMCGWFFEILAKF